MNSIRTMFNNTNWTTFSVALFVLSIASTFMVQAATFEAAAIIQSEHPHVEVMFVLDTTGSMSGLIEAAKDKIWSIANTLATADPAPQIKMGLVGYRDRGDAYVTKFTTLNADLDQVYSDLMQFQAQGGGDTPESVNQALYEAISKPDWSSGANTYRVIFLIGDAPPHMDYTNDIQFRRSCQIAVTKDIIINTIQCGNLGQTTPIWKEIANAAGGHFFQVTQSGSAIMYDTPFDEEISHLSIELEKTRIFYGDKKALADIEARKKTADEIYRHAKPSAVAKRSIFNAGKAGEANFIGENELITAIDSGRVQLDKVKKDELPEELRGLSLIDLKRHVTAQSLKRKRLQAQIRGLADKRQTFIKNKVNAQKGKGAQSLDAGIYRCIQKQAGAKGIEYQKGPIF